MFFFGSKGNALGQFDIKHTYCTHCGTADTQRVTVFGKYAHIYWIPFFPIGKKTFAECTHCKRTIEEKEFPSQLRTRFDEVKGRVKRPIWHWTGLGLVGALAIFISLIGALREVDPREELLKADLASMTANPVQESDSTSYFLKGIFDAFISDKMEKEKFEYLTRTNGDKLLVLLKIPDLKRVAKEERSFIFETVEKTVGIMDQHQGKDLYIGIHGKYNMMMVKTPTETESSKIASQEPLFDFYGPKPVEVE